MLRSGRVGVTVGVDVGVKVGVGVAVAVEVGVKVLVGVVVKVGVEGVLLFVFGGGVLGVSSPRTKGRYMNEFSWLAVFMKEEVLDCTFSTSVRKWIPSMRPTRQRMTRK